MLMCFGTFLTRCHPPSPLKFHKTSTRELRTVILGATGETGKPLLRQALAAGHEVTAIVRDASKVSTTHRNLTVVNGNVFSPEFMQSHFAGHDVIVSALGFPKQKDVMSEFTSSMAAIIAAMRAVRVRRLVTISAWYTDPKSRVGQYMFDKMWAKIAGLVHTLDNEGEMEAMLAASTDDIDYTSVRVPTLTWDPQTGKEFMCAVGANWVEDGSGFIPREDVARFMVSTLDDPERWKNKAVAIAIKYTDEEMQAAAVRFREHMAMYTQ